MVHSENLIKNLSGQTYECEGGYLENDIDFITLSEMAKLLEDVYWHSGAMEYLGMHDEELQDKIYAIFK